MARAIQVWRAKDERLPVLLGRYDETADALRHYGLVLWGGGDVLAGSQALTAAAALRPTDARIWADLSSAHGALGQSTEAVCCAEESLALEPRQPSMWLHLGSVKSALGETGVAVVAYDRALAIDPTLTDAWVGLGLAHLRAKSFHKAIHALREAITRGKAEDANIQGCLGEALLSIGQFEPGAAAFDIASRLQPDNAVFAAKVSRARFMLDAIRGPALEAVAAFEARSKRAEDIAKTLRDGFQVLGAFGYRAEAIRLGEVLQARDPADEMHAYLLATLKGEAMERAPERYIVTFFDRFAQEFDHVLVDLLEYKVPVDLSRLTEDFLLREGRTVSRVLDLGCGTGLVGARLARAGRVLTGVDLSPRMLDEARRRGIYEDLVEAEVVTFLSGAAQAYDLIVAADVLIYFGHLSPLFGGVARALRVGGVFAFSLESSETEDIAHLSSGRFAHGLGYLEREAARHGFETIEIRPTAIRLERDGHAMGVLVLLTRSSDVKKA